MLASLGFFVQEAMGYHPLLNNSSSGVDAVADPALKSFWPFAFALIGVFEAADAAFSYDKPMDTVWNPIWGSDWTFRKHRWEVKEDKVYGQYGNAFFDPLRLAPKDPEAYKDMQTRELNNGRLGMLGAAGIIAQESVTGQGFTEFDALGPTVVAYLGGAGLLTACVLAFWDLVDDKNSGFQGTESQDRWKFGAQRYDDNPALELENSGLTGVSTGTVTRPAFDSLAYAKTLPGIYATVAPGQQGIFDPLGFCSAPGTTKQKVDYFRDAETKHGRLGMLATVGILGSEAFHPLAGAKANGVPAVLAILPESPYNQLPNKNSVPLWFWVALLGGIGVVESQAMRGDIDYSKQKRMWDPANYTKGGTLLEENKDTELAFGRIGMVAAIGMIAQEFATGKAIVG
jgi:hypothetical protein